MPSKHTGRVPKLTPERHTKIIEILRAGNYRSVAAGFVGVEQRTVARWMDLGKSGHETYSQFYHDVLKAEHEAEIRNVTSINTIAKKDWRAAKDWLESKHPERWASKKRLEISGEITVKEVAAAFNSALQDEDDVPGGNWKGIDDAFLGDDES